MWAQAIDIPQLYIHDMNNPKNDPILPGPVSNKLTEITSLQWNTTVSRVFAASSSSGYTSVWDLKAGKEIVSLQYGGGAARGDLASGMASLQIGKRRGMSDVAWHPEQATRLATASEDDESPIIMLWDLRNTRAPERILSGHTKGVLSLSWCKQDSELLASCGKDNRTLIWNPTTGDIVGEMPRTVDWAFQTAWFPSNPNLIATASFDGHITIDSLQSTNPEAEEATPIAQDASAEDVFGALGAAGPNEDRNNVQSLTQAPKWMKRPVSATFGYGGLLATVSNLPGANGKNQSSVVHLRQITTEETIVERAKQLSDIAADKEKLKEFSSGKEEAAWKAINTLFHGNSRDELVALLGFSKEDVAKHVQEAIAKISPAEAAEIAKEKEQAKQEAETKEKIENEEATPKSDTTPKSSAASPQKSAASELFEDRSGTPATAGGDTDFFASMASGSLRNPRLDNVIPHMPQDASVAATIGSGSSVRSESLIKDNNFHIYPTGESETDRLITQALVLGDFTSAVDLCMASERYADALLLAVRGGPELLAQTQKAYFRRCTETHPFLRVYQSIVTEDLADIVQNADLAEWRVIFVVLCTFAKDQDFGNLADQLGQRLQFKWQLLAASDAPESKAKAKEARTDATLCYLAARNLEHVVNIWISEMQEDEAQSSGPRYTAHANALQSFIEKVTVFQAATGYVDKDLTTTTAPDTEAARTYALSGLYDRLYEYADLLATQGLVDAAAKYVQMTPKGYSRSQGGAQLDHARDRLFAAAGVQEAGPSKAASSSAFGGKKSASATASSSRYPAASSGYGASPYGASASPYGAQSSFQQTSNPYGAPSNAYSAQTQSGPYGAAQPQTQSSPYAPPPSQHQPQQSQQQQSNPYAPPPSQQQQSQSSPYTPTGQQQSSPYNPYGGSSNGYGAPSQTQYGATSQFQPAYGNNTVPPPPPKAGQSANVRSQTPSEPVVPASQRRDMPGWNDAPSMGIKRPSSSARNTPKAAPITSPFPMAEGAPNPYAAPPSAGAAPPPPGPPRGGNAPGILPPPPKGGPRPPSASANRASASPQPRVMSPPITQPFGQTPSPNPYAAQPQPPSNPYAAQSQPPSNPYAAPPQHQQFGGPPPPGARAGPPPPCGGPPPPGVVAGPPPQRAMSPLGPNAGRPQQHLGGLASPPAHNAHLAGPPPPGVRAGPPPPGRAGTASPAQNSAPSPAPAAPPAAPKHPAGDRSHLTDSGRPIYEGLNSELQRIKSGSPPAHLKRIVDDTERRLNILFDDLNNDTVAPATVEKLSEIVQGELASIRHELTKQPSMPTTPTRPSPSTSTSSRPPRATRPIGPPASSS